MDRINLVHEAITISTIAPYSPTELGQLIATVKIIPFAVHETILSECEEIASSVGSLFSVAAYQNQRVGLLQTVLPNFRKPLLAKGKEVTASRLAGMELQLDLERTADHSEAAVGEAIAGFQRRCATIGAWRVGHCGSPRRGARRH